MKGSHQKPLVACWGVQGGSGCWRPARSTPRSHTDKRLGQMMEGADCGGASGREGPQPQPQALLRVRRMLPRHVDAS